ncbi:hypothetical protein Q3G72_031131 [Acer saccharum]|nr:hypothetical protein Q3G72_031131 [Acer saccharum]
MRSDSRKDHDDGDDHIVMGDEIARAVRCVMDGDSEIRKKVKEMSGKSMLEGGSSFDSIGKFIDSSRFKGLLTFLFTSRFKTHFAAGLFACSAVRRIDFYFIFLIRNYDGLITICGMM